MLLLCVSRPRLINRDGNFTLRINGPGMNEDVHFVIWTFKITPLCCMPYSSWKVQLKTLDGYTRIIDPRKTIRYLAKNDRICINLKWRKPWSCWRWISLRTWVVSSHLGMRRVLQHVVYRFSLLVALRLVSMSNESYNNSPAYDYATAQSS